MIRAVPSAGGAFPSSFWSSGPQSVDSDEGEGADAEEKRIEWLGERECLAPFESNSDPRISTAPWPRRSGLRRPLNVREVPPTYHTISRSTTSEIEATPSVTERGEGHRVGLRGAERQPGHLRIRVLELHPDGSTDRLWRPGGQLPWPSRSWSMETWFPAMTHGPA